MPTDRAFPLGGLHSSAIHTILTGAFLKEVPPHAMLGIELFLMRVVVALSLRFSPIPFSVTTMAAAGVYLGAAASAFLFAGLILNIARPLLMVFHVFAAIQILCALFMALIRTLLRSSLIQYYEEKAYHPDSVSNQAAEALERVVSRVNTYLDETHGDANMFATLFIGLLDPETGMLYYINAGHEKPVIISPAGLKGKLGTCGPAVGAFPEVAYQTDSVQLAPGDFCFVCTDGVTDAQNPSREFFTKENLISLLTRPCDSAETMLDRIRRSLLCHIADADQFDDITMVLLQRNAAAGPSL